MKKSLLAVAVTGLFAVSGAQAATDWGVHAPVETGIASLTGSFSEIFTFSLSAPTTTLSTIAISFESTPVFGLSADSMVWLYKETGAVDTFTAAYSFGTLFTASNLLAGDYYYKVTGSTTGSLGGVFALTSTTAPIAVVPEADTYLMMLAGLGMIGLMAKRRMS
jgi:hypothetical protein